MRRRTALGAIASAFAIQFIGEERAYAVSTQNSPIPQIGPRSGMTSVTATGFEQMFQTKNDSAWSGSDQATSFMLNGFHYWFFGDTILGTENANGGYNPGWTMVGNTIMMQDGDQLIRALVDGSHGVPNPPSRNTNNNERYWAQGAFALGSTLYVLCQRVQTGSDGGFQPIGGEIAKFQQGLDGKLTLVGMFMTPATGKTEIEGVYGIQWCSEAVVSDDYVYIYGATRATYSDQLMVLHYSYVARVPQAQLEIPSAWRFYKESTNSWVSRIDDLSQDNVNQSDAIVASQLSSVRFINGRYVMLHKPWNGWGNEVKATTSLTPYGPWTIDVVIFSSPEGTFEGLPYETYCPQLHPEFVLTSGKTLVSIAWNFKNADLATIGSNADLYKPRFHEVQF